MRKSFLWLLFLHMFLGSFSQTPGIKWSRPIGGENSDRIMDVQKTTDGGYLFTGETRSNNGDVSGLHGGFDIWVVKTNGDGTILWQKCLGGSGNESFRKVIYHANGSALIVGTSTSADGDVVGNHNSTDIWLVKIDDLGNISWQKSLGGTATEEFRSIDTVAGGGYVLSGYTSSNDGDVVGNHGNEDIWVVKLGNDGSIAWQSCLGGSATDRPRHIMAMADGNYIMVGSTASGDGQIAGHHGNNDVWVVKLDGTGNIIWQGTYGGTGSDTGFMGLLDNLGNLTILANTLSNDGDVNGMHSPGMDVWLIQVRYTDGSIVWSKCIGGSGIDSPNQLLKNTDNSFLVSSTTSSTDGDATNNNHNQSGRNDIMLTHLSNSGLVLWSKCYGGSSNESFRSIYQDTANQSFILLGTTMSQDGDVSGIHMPRNPGDSIMDGWLVKVTSAGEVEWQRCLGGSTSDYLYSLTKEDQNSFVIAGESDSENGDVERPNKFGDGWILKIGMTNTIKGSIFLDSNLNGIKDADEGPFYEASVLFTKNGFSKSTIPYNGFFVNDVDTGTYSTSVQINSPYYTVVPSSINSGFSSYFNTDSVSFAIQPLPGKKDLKINLIPTTPARPGFRVGYHISYANVGTETVASGQVLFRKDSKLTLLTASPNYTLVNGDTLIWNYTNLKPSDSSSITLQFEIAPPPTVNIGDTLISSAIVDPVSGDLTPRDDTATIKHLVQGSFDPNDKYENNGGVVTPELIANEDYLNYTIRFQNMGTDTAFTIVVRDTLDNRLNWNTLQMVAASHSYSLSIEEGNRLAWTFNNILLPDDKIDEPKSHGFISYRIKPMKNAPVNDTIHNFASIYFDYNLPVRTNNAFTVIRNVIALPVQLLSFNGVLEGDRVSLKWVAATEVNFDRYEIERSVDNKEFQKIGSETHRSGSGHQYYNYENFLSGVSGSVFEYRLKMIDKDGSCKYSPVILLRRKKEVGSSLILHPNPYHTGTLYATVNTQTNSIIDLRIIDIGGKVVYSNKEQVFKGTNVLNLLGVSNLPSGIYHVQLISNTEMLQQKVIVKDSNY